MKETTGFDRDLHVCECVFVCLCECIDNSICSSPLQACPWGQAFGSLQSLLPTPCWFPMAVPVPVVVRVSLVAWLLLPRPHVFVSVCDRFRLLRKTVAVTRRTRRCACPLQAACIVTLVSAIIDLPLCRVSTATVVRHMRLSQELRNSARFGKQVASSGPREVQSCFTKLDQQSSVLGPLHSISLDDSLMLTLRLQRHEHASGGEMRGCMSTDRMPEGREGTTRAEGCVFL